MTPPVNAGITDYTPLSGEMVTLHTFERPMGAYTNGAVWVAKFDYQDGDMLHEDIPVRLYQEHVNAIAKLHRMKGKLEGYAPINDKRICVILSTRDNSYRVASVKDAKGEWHDVKVRELGSLAEVPVVRNVPCMMVHIEKVGINRIYTLIFDHEHDGDYVGVMVRSRQHLREAGYADIVTSWDKHEPGKYTVPSGIVADLEQNTTTRKWQMRLHVRKTEPEADDVQTNAA